MKVMWIMEGNDCALRIEPEDEEGRALLAAFGVRGEFTTRLAPLGTGKSAVDLQQVASCYEGAPVEVD